MPCTRLAHAAHSSPLHAAPSPCRAPVRRPPWPRRRPPSTTPCRPSPAPLVSARHPLLVDPFSDLSRRTACTVPVLACGVARLRLPSLRSHRGPNFGKRAPPNPSRRSPSSSRPACARQMLRHVGSSVPQRDALCVALVARGGGTPRVACGREVVRRFCGDLCFQCPALGRAFLAARRRPRPAWVAHRRRSRSRQSSAATTLPWKRFGRSPARVVPPVPCGAANGLMSIRRATTRIRSPRPELPQDRPTRVCLILAACVAKICFIIPTSRPGHSFRSQVLTHWLGGFGDFGDASSVFPRSGLGDAGQNLLLLRRTPPEPISVWQDKADHGRPPDSRGFRPQSARGGGAPSSVLNAQWATSPFLFVRVRATCVRATCCPELHSTVGSGQIRPRSWSKSWARMEGQSQAGSTGGRSMRRFGATRSPDRGSFETPCSIGRLGLGSPAKWLRAPTFKLACSESPATTAPVPINILALGRAPPSRISNYNGLQHEAI